MLEQLQGRGHIYATDVDPEESAKTRKRLADAGYGEDILTIKLQNFCTIDEIAKEAGGFDFILADLGVSSMQIDNPERGFSFKVDGPLDLRLNQTQGISAAERLDTIGREELAGMLYFTDGKGRYPAKRPDYRTAFLFLEDYDDAAVPPWAMRLLLEKEEFLN